ncbi:hypothetical protein KO317_02845 [Candidatus Micrarchaeota archaeon]|nr:hypothetical protein [Candidatus Micrarchaeota archaeon]
MKKILAMFALVAVLLFFMGCTETTKNTEIAPTNGETQESTTESVEKPSTDSNLFKGFIDWEPGMWVEWKSDDMITKMAIVEKSEGILKFQSETEIEGMSSISQIWYDENTMELIKYITKTEGMVICFDGQTTEESVKLETDEAYSGQVPNMGYGTYTTPTGKTVNVAKFTTTDGEYWVSDEVPFGMVKISFGDIDQMLLNDFGTIGAVNKITSEDIANCQDLGSMFPTQ